MKITFEYDGVKASERLEELAQTKLVKLEAKYQFIVQAHVFLKTQNTSSPQSGKICKIQLSVPGPQLFAEDNNHSFEAALQATTNELGRQLAKKKDKMRAH